MIHGLKQSYIQSHELIAFIESLPFDESGECLSFLLQDNDLIGTLTVCQVDRFASIELMLAIAKRSILTLKLPYYDWIRLNQFNDYSSITFGKTSNRPRDGDLIPSVNCPVTFQFRPHLSVRFEDFE